MKLRKFYKKSLSRDYKKLWELLMAGNEIIVFFKNTEVIGIYSDYIGIAKILPDKSNGQTGISIGSPDLESLVKKGGSTSLVLFENEFFDYCQNRDLIFIEPKSNKKQSFFEVDGINIMPNNFGILLKTPNDTVFLNQSSINYLISYLKIFSKYDSIDISITEALNKCSEIFAKIKENAEKTETQDLNLDLAKELISLAIKYNLDLWI